MNAKYEDLKKLLNMTTEDHLNGVETIMKALKPFHQAREDTYDMSFARRGETGVWYNLARKYDRIDGLAEDRLENSKNTRVLIDTLVDNVMYSLKWLELLMRLDSGAFKEWVTGVYAKDCGISAEEALERFWNIRGELEVVEYLGSLDPVRDRDGNIVGVMSDRPLPLDCIRMPDGTVIRSFNHE